MTIELDHIKWTMYNGALIPDAPPHIEIKLTRNQARYLLRKSKAYFLRWSSDFDCGFETEWWYLVRDKGIDLNEFESKRRREIQKGLRNCMVKKVDAAFLAQNGYEVYSSAFASYDTFLKPAGEEEFISRMMSRKDNPIFDFWAGFDKTDGQLIGYFMNRLGEDFCLYSAAKFKPDSLHLGVHHALVYQMTNYYLSEMGLKYVCTGARSISHKTNAQEFLIKKLHYRKAYCRLNIIYRPIIGILAKSLYPFRNIISKIDTNVTNKITVLLRQEKIRRSFSDKK